MIDTTCSVGRGVDRVRVDTAGTGSRSRGELDVTLVAPAGTPGVADENVVLTLFGSVTNGGNTVVKVGAASVAGENSALVALEDGLVSLDGDGNNGLCDSGIELAGAVASHTR